MRTTGTKRDWLLGEAQLAALAYLILAQVAVVDLAGASHDFERQRQQARSLLNSAQRALTQTSGSQVARRIDSVSLALSYVACSDTKKPQVLGADLGRVIQYLNASETRSVVRRVKSPLR